MTELESLLQRLIGDGADPNELQREFRVAVSGTLDWALFGDGRWRRHVVCSKCGSVMGGLCADPGTDVKVEDFDNPAYHKNQPGVRMLPYREYLTKQEDTR